jgi:hypothetical protein
MAKAMGQSVEELDRKDQVDLAKSKANELFRYRERSKADYDAYERNRAIIEGRGYDADAMTEYLNKQMKGRGVGDGPLNEVSAKEMFRQKMGRYPDSEQELMDFMRKMNETSSMPVDGVFAPKGGRRRNPMTARDRRLAGRGKPRETEASRLLKMLDDAEDELTGGSKKKNTSKNYV